MRTHSYRVCNSSKDYIFPHSKHIKEVQHTRTCLLIASIDANVYGLLFYFPMFSHLGWRLGLQAVTGSLTSLFFLGLFYRSASLYHPQRRAILHLKDMSKRKGKDKNKMESKPPYFDFSMLKSRQFQVRQSNLLIARLNPHPLYPPGGPPKHRSELLWRILSPLLLRKCPPAQSHHNCYTSQGLWKLSSSSFPHQIPMSVDEGLGQDSAVQLQTFLGSAMALGAAFFGLIVLSRSRQCMVSRQYLLQAATFGIGECSTQYTCLGKETC